MAYERQTDEALKVIARDLFGGIIFCDRHCKSADEVKMSFAILSLGSAEYFRSLKDEKITFFYEYLSEAGPRSVNGRPFFMSMRVLNDEDEKRMFVYYNKYKEFEASI